MRAVNVLVAALVAVLLTGGCSRGRADPAPTSTAAPSKFVPRLRAGTQVELTAAVSQVFGAHAFLIADVDLPPSGQLVVSDAAVTVAVDDLVTVSGLVRQLDRAALARYGADDPTGLAVVAASVRNLAS
ncbi:hypothetical protein ACQP00_18740 [Dactylosporangium sp. CS-047395]|uniref:hypothetical protein n=1 Tax=Dactylosporangium sp. CS-047395 TaxID=3239936 RepID=UPI003D8AAE91